MFGNTNRESLCSLEIEVELGTGLGFIGCCYGATDFRGDGFTGTMLFARLFARLFAAICPGTFKVISCNN